MNNLASVIDSLRAIFTMAFLAESAIALGAALAVLVFNRLATGRMLKVLRTISAKTERAWDDRLIDASEVPLRFLLRTFAVYSFLVLFPLTAAYGAFWMDVLRSMLILALARVLSRFAEDLSLLVFKGVDQEEIRQTVKPILTQSIRVVVFALAVLMIAQEWGYDIKGFIAGLGLAGFAVAMGAQDTITNVMSGLFLIVDRTVDVGDWIATDQVEGVVEELSFRTTKIRTFEQSLITVPNSVLANKPVVNYTKRGLRRIKFDLGVMYKTTSEQLQTVVEEIKEMLLAHPRVAADTVYVRFLTFNDSSLDIMVYCFTDAMDYQGYIAVREEINFRILDILEAASVSAAFPSTSVYIEQEAVPDEGQTA